MYIWKWTAFQFKVLLNSCFLKSRVCCTTIATCYIKWGSYNSFARRPSKYNKPFNTVSFFNCVSIWIYFTFLHLNLKPNGLDGHNFLWLKQMPQWLVHYKLLCTFWKYWVGSILCHYVTSIETWMITYSLCKPEKDNILRKRSTNLKYFYSKSAVDLR